MDLFSSLKDGIFLDFLINLNLAIVGILQDFKSVCTLTGYVVSVTKACWSTWLDLSRPFSFTFCSIAQAGRPFFLKYLPLTISTWPNRKGPAQLFLPLYSLHPSSQSSRDRVLENLWSLWLFLMGRPRPWQVSHGSIYFTISWEEVKIRPWLFNPQWLGFEGQCKLESLTVDGTNSLQLRGTAPEIHWAREHWTVLRRCLQNRWVRNYTPWPQRRHQIFLFRHHITLVILSHLYIVGWSILSAPYKLSP